MSDEALSAANNGHIFARKATKYGANPAAKIVLFLSGISISLPLEGKVASSVSRKPDDG